MVLGSVVAVVGTALCTGAINGVPSHSRLYFLTTNAIVQLGCSLLDICLLLGIGGVVVGAIGPVNIPLGQRFKGRGPL
jgi:hypothetical protein